MMFLQICDNLGGWGGKQNITHVQSMGDVNPGGDSTENVCKVVSPLPGIVPKVIQKKTKTAFYK